MDFDTEKYIYEIENRPPLWNMKIKEYSDRIIKIKMWEEVVDIFGGKELTTDGKKKLGVSLQKKWKNLRDAFVKEYRKISTLKSGSGATKKSTYMYFNQLMFLKDVVAINKTDNNFTEESQETQEQASEVDYSEEREGPYETEATMKNTPRRKKTKANDTEESDKIGSELITILRENISDNDADPDRHFLLSLLDDFKRIPDHLKAKTKIKMMQMIMEATEQHSNNHQLPLPQPRNYSCNAYSANDSSYISLDRNATNQYETLTNPTSPESVSTMSDDSRLTNYYNLFSTKNL